MPCAYCKANHDSDSCPGTRERGRTSRVKTLKSRIRVVLRLFYRTIGYPDVNIGILTPPGVNYENYDAPRSWAEKGTSISL